LTVVLSIMGAMDAIVVYLALWTADSSFCSRKTAPISRVMALILPHWIGNYVGKCRSG